MDAQRRDAINKARGEEAALQGCMAQTPDPQPKNEINYLQEEILKLRHIIHQQEDELLRLYRQLLGRDR